MVGGESPRRAEEVRNCAKQVQCAEGRVGKSVEVRQRKQFRKQRGLGTTGNRRQLERSDTSIRRHARQEPSPVYLLFFVCPARMSSYVFK